MFSFIASIAKVLGIPEFLLFDSSFYNYFSNWYYHNHHYWEYIPDNSLYLSSADDKIIDDDWYISSKEILTSDYLECNHNCDLDDYISDSGSDYDMSEFDSYYYEYV